MVLEDLLPARLPDLQEYDVDETHFVDVVTPVGIAAVGLPPDYPTIVPHPRCQAIATRAYAADENGLATLSAVETTGEELVIFDRVVDVIATKGIRRKARSWLNL